MGILPTLPNRWWDPKTGVRERLALLGAIGPALDPERWRYDPRHDQWEYLGGARQIQGRAYVPTMLADDSIKRLMDVWQISRDHAFDLIWRPDEERIRGSYQRQEPRRED